ARHLRGPRPTHPRHPGRRAAVAPHQRAQRPEGGDRRSRRDRRRPQPRRGATSPPRSRGAGAMSRIVVLGGRLAGIASAGLLARDGHRVTLVEQGEVLGGRAGTWRSDGFLFDTGPSWMLMREPYEHAFRKLGSRLEDELELVRLDPAYRVLYEGEA